MVMYLECRDIIKVYATQHLLIPALRGIELIINKTDLIALIGPSGAGKTTLLNLIAGFDKPTSGYIRVGDVVVSDLNPGKELDIFRRTKLGILNQFPEQNLIGYLSALKNVMMPMKILGSITMSEQRRRAKELLRIVGLLYRENHKPKQLSGGEAQRLGIAVALANDPDLLLADEPTGEIDSESTLEIIEYFKSLNKELGTTIIVVTHDQQFANMTKRTYEILDGKIVRSHKETTGKARIESIFVDSFGNVQIPEEIRKIVGINSEVRFEIRDGQVVILPVTKDENQRKE